MVMRFATLIAASALVPYPTAMRLSSIPASVPRPLRKKLALPMAQTSLASSFLGRFTVRTPS